MNVALPVLVIFLSLADGPPDPAILPPPPPALQPGFAAIDEADLRTWVTFLASDELKGRGTGTHGYDPAARFCALLLERYGVKPAGDGGTFFQDFEIVRGEVDEAGSFLEVKDGSGTERLPLGGNISLSRPGAIDWTCRWSFAGHGLGPDGGSPGDYAAIPVKERVALVLPTSEWTSFQKRHAEEAGATRVAVISDFIAEKRFWIGAIDRPEFMNPPAKSPTEPDIIYLSRKAANLILRGRKTTVEGMLGSGERPPPFEIDGAEVRLVVRYKESKYRARNVVGILEGSDPDRRGEALAIGAHLDHLGEADGKIYPGADDDASGSAAVLALAKAFAASPRPPARSVLFTLFAAEEKGLWGSAYFVDHPGVPARKIMGEIQLDMIGRNPDSERVRLGTDNSNVNLNGPVLLANRFIGLEFEFDTSYFGASDHFNFRRKGIPVAVFFTGFHPDYHEPTDTVEKINFPKMVRIVRLAFAAAHAIADRQGPLLPSRRL